MVDIEQYKKSYYNENLTREELWKRYGGTRRESFKIFSSMNPKRKFKDVINCSFNKKDSINKRKENNLKKYGTSCTLNLGYIDKKRTGNLESLQEAREKQKKLRQQNPGIWSLYVREGMKRKNNYSDLYLLLDKDNIEFLVEILEEFGQPKIYDLCFATGLQFSQAQKYINKFKLRNRFDISESKLESIIKNILDKTNVAYEMHNRNVIAPLELDFYIPKYNLAIEVNDFWSHTSDIKGSNYHLMKSKECLKKNIRLIHLFEDEILNKTDIIESIIRNSLRLSNSINAGSCKSKLIPAKESREFLNKNHRQGYGSSASIHYGLYFRKELVACMTFRRIKGKETEWELYRFANKLNTSVRVGAYRLLEKFKKENCWTKIISFSDIAHTSGKLYEKLGFSKSYETQPNYFYISKDGKIINRIACQKHKLKKLLDNFDENLSESQNMKNNFYKKIYDCGSIKWEIAYR